MGLFNSLFGGDQAGDVKDAAKIQAAASEKAAELQFKAFEKIRRDFRPFLATGTDATNFLRGLFFGTGPMADLFFEPGPISPIGTGTETITNPAIAELQRRISRLPRTVRQRDPSIGPREAAEFPLREFRDVPNPEIARLQAQLAGLSPTITRTVQTGGTPTRGERRNFGDIVKAFDPTFGFRQSEGEKAINRGLAARGLSASGQAGQALSEFNTNLALGSSQNFLNNLFNLAGFGPTSASQLGQFGLGAAGAGGGFLQNAGAARASGLIGAGNIRAQNLADLERTLLSGGGLAAGFLF